MFVSLCSSGEQASHWSRDGGDSHSPLVSGPIRGQRAQTIAGLPSASVSAEKHKMFAGEALKRAGC